MEYVNKKSSLPFHFIIANSELNRRMKGLSTSLRPLWYFIRRMLAFVCPLPVRSLLIVIKRRGTRFADVPNEFVTILCNIYISLNYLNFLVYEVFFRHETQWTRSRGSLLVVFHLFSSFFLPYFLLATMHLCTSQM